MITNLGKELRKLRLDRGITLFDMAQALNVSSSLLSSVETGKKPASKSLIDKLAATYPEIQSNRAHFEALAEQTLQEVRIRISNEAPQTKELALMFARNFNTLDQQQVQQMLAIFAPKDAK